MPVLKVWSRLEISCFVFPFHLQFMQTSLLCTTPEVQVAFQRLSHILSGMKQYILLELATLPLITFAVTLNTVTSTTFQGFSNKGLMLVLV